MSTETRGGGLASMNGWWAASGLFILLVIVGVVIAIFGGTGATPSNAQPPPPPTTPAAGPAATPAPSDPADEPLMSAPDTQWDLFYDIALPTSPTAGPTVQDGRLWSGYERSPAGALMAGAYLLAATDSPEAPVVMESHAVAGPYADIYLNEVTLTPPSAPTPGMTPAFGGFRFADYADDGARVEYLLVGPDYAASLPVDLAWQDGDWRINFEPASGQPKVTRLDGTSGFIPWSAAG